MYNLSVRRAYKLLQNVANNPTTLLTKVSRLRFHSLLFSFVIATLLLTGILYTGARSAMDNVNAPIWTRIVGQVNNDQLIGLGIDGTGSPIAVGFFDGSNMDFGEQSASSTQKDVFISKYNTDGTVEWINSLGGADIDEGRGVAIDSANSIYVTGNFRQTVNLGSGSTTSMGNDDIFISKYDTNGDLLWGWSAGGTEADQGWDVAVDSGTNVYATGYFSGAVNFGGTAATTFTSTGDTNDVFIVGLNPNGSFRWANYIAGESGDRGNGIAVDSTRGFVYVTGFIQSDANFSPTTGGSILDTSARDIFLAKYSSTTGEFIDTIIIGDPGSRDFGQAVAVDEATGTVYIVGAFDGTVDFDPNTGSSLEAQGRSDIFVAAYNSGLDYLWAVNAGGAGEDVGETVAIGPAGNVYVSGWFAETADFDPDPSSSFEQTSAGDHDAFVLTLDSTGRFLAVATLGGSGQDQSLGLAVDANQRLYHGGFFQGTIDIDPTSTEELKTSGGKDDIFLSALSSNLAPRADEQDVTVNEDSSIDIILSGSDPNSEAITITLTTPPPISGTVSGLMMTGDTTATVTYAPNPNFAGQDSFAFLVTDASGFSTIGTVNVAVTNINDVPTADPDRSFTTGEDSILAIAADAGLLTGKTSDTDTGDLLTASADETTASGATLIVNADGGFSYDPSPINDYQALAVGESMTDTFTYVVTDSSGESDSASVMITVEGQNDDPIANDDSGYTTPGSTELNATTSVLSNDRDVDSSDRLTVDTMPVVLPNSGSVTLKNDGTFVYVPATGFNGADSFTYRVIDGNGGEATAKVNIVVGNANIAPSVENSAADVVVNGILNGSSLLTGVTDPNGDELTIESTPFTAPASGAVVINQDGTYTYTPNAGYIGMDSFTYRVCDNGTPVLCSEATVTIDVSETPTQPEKSDNVYIPMFIN